MMPCPHIAVREYVQRGLAQKAKYVLVGSDNFEYALYPIFCTCDEDVNDVLNRLPWHEHKNGCEDTVMYAIDLTGDIEAQLAENKPRHIPR